MIAHPLPSYLADRFSVWKRTRFEDSRAWFARLMEAGQHPRLMLISCCDSRVDTTAMFGSEPGDVFVVRNVASLVPPYAVDHNHHGTSAAVEYAVTALKVAHIMVVGHSSCGGVKACHDMCSGQAPELEQDMSFIGRWMDILRPGFERIEGRHADPKAQLRELEHEAVRTSLRNLMSFPFVEEAVKGGQLTIHGGWIDIAEGEFHVLSSDGERFAPV